MFTDFVSARLTESGIFLEEENETGGARKKWGRGCEARRAKKRGWSSWGGSNKSPFIHQLEV